MDGLTDGVIIALVPGLVEVAKRLGLPVRFAGLAAILAAVALIALRDLAMKNGGTGSVSRWVIGGVTLGLAAAGLYSQTKRIAAG
jgi:hypothetical protein